MSLLFADFASALVNVLAVIAIIIAGGFIIFFLGDLLLSILDPKTEEKKNAKQGKSEKNEKQETIIVPVEELKEEVEELKNEISALKGEISKDDQQEIKEVDNSLVEKELAELGLVQDDLQSTDGMQQLRDAEEEFRRKNLAAIEEKKNQLQSQPSDELDFDNIFFDDEDFSFGEFQYDDEPVKAEESIQGQVSFLAETDEDAEESEEKVEEVAEESEISEDVVEESKVEDEDIEQLKKELEAEKAEYERLIKQAEKEKNKWLEERENLENLFENAEGKEEFVPLMSLEAYESRLEVLKERLKANEKDLKTNKKEYLPLMRVRKTLDNDKRKLARREALVAKQKVVLYGVNNYVDMDEEKAKKLAEDMDLLDGLRASVQHCEEVILASKERYPILETAYRILTTTNKDIKEDIKQVEFAINELKAKEEKVEVSEEAAKAETDTNTEN